VTGNVACSQHGAKGGYQCTISAWGAVGLRWYLSKSANRGRVFPSQAGFWRVDGRVRPQPAILLRFPLNTPLTKAPKIPGPLRLTSATLVKWRQLHLRPLQRNW
jgi:hypothetical protein